MEILSRIFIYYSITLVRDSCVMVCIYARYINSNKNQFQRSHLLFLPKPFTRPLLMFTSSRNIYLNRKIFAEYVRSGARRLCLDGRHRNCHSFINDLSPKQIEFNVSNWTNFFYSCSVCFSRFLQKNASVIVLLDILCLSSIDN